MTVGRDDLSGDGVALVQRDPDGVDDGTVEPVSTAAVPVLDRGFLYGDAVFETLRCYGGEPAFVDRHADRFAEGLARLDVAFEPPGGVADWIAGVADRLLDGLEHPTESDHRDAYLRVSVTRGVQEDLLAPTETAPTVVAVARPLARRRYGAARVVTTEVRRPSVAAELKTHNYLGSVLARADARGADEALMLAADGDAHVSGAASNLFARVDGAWRAPIRDARPGVTREVVLGLCADQGVAVDERPADDVDAVEAAFLTNTTWGVRRVATIDGRPLDDDGLIGELRRRYLRRVGAVE